MAYSALLRSLYLLYAPRDLLSLAAVITLSDSADYRCLYSLGTFHLYFQGGTGYYHGKTLYYPIFFNWYDLIRHIINYIKLKGVLS